MEESLQFTSILEISTNKLWGAHLPVPHLIAQTFLAEDAKRVICTLNEKVEFQCALVPKGEGVYCIVVNKKIRDQLGLKEGSTARVSLKKDDSEYGLPMPEELAEVLAQDEEGNRLFHGLTPGKLRTLLYIVGHVKNTDVRISRAFAIVEHLKANGGKINYKQLHEDLKK
ncbi:MAG TPA: YdeI/OmpD-associated family protein [Saprospiraceae bacterium]|nr:YdeI/OmpD-associated family protein [Saprospiraceae bacterium]